MVTKLTPTRHPDLAEAIDVTLDGQAAGIVGRRGERWEARTYDGARIVVATREDAIDTLIKLAR